MAQLDMSILVEGRKKQSKCAFWSFANAEIC